MFKALRDRPKHKLLYIMSKTRMILGSMGAMIGTLVNLVRRFAVLPTKLKPISL
jgi:hypothetical protein